MASVSNNESTNDHESPHKYRQPMSSRSFTGSPPLKRVKIESPLSTPPDRFPRANTPDSLKLKVDSDLNDDYCSICLQQVFDRTVIPTCAHEFCFECLLVWSEQSRRCPLCSQSIGEYLIHHIRSKYDYQKHYLTTLRTSPVPLQPLPGAQRIRNTHRSNTRPIREREWGRRERREREEADQLDRAISRRRWIYEHNLYAKHVASNSYTRYRPYPSPAQFSASSELISRTTAFLRRELRVWVNLDVEFLTTFIISLMKAIDIRSESAIKLLAEFLDMDAPYVEGAKHVNAEHFAHEVYCFVRSPFKDLFVYDTVVQYESPSGIPPPPDQQRSRRWQAASSRSRSPPRRSYSPEICDRQLQRSRSRSLSWSPSGRRYLSTKERITDEKIAAESRRRRSHSRSYDCDKHNSKCPQRFSHGRQWDGDNAPEDNATKGNGCQRKNDLENRGPHTAHNSNTQLIERGGLTDVKGKRRGDVVGDNVEVAPPSTAETVERPTVAELRTKRQQEDRPSADPNPVQGKPISLSRGRHPRTLLESVQAHLAPATSRPNTTRKGKEKDLQRHSPRAGHPSSLLEHSGSCSSLLSRLSDPSPDDTRSSFTQPTSSTPPSSLDMSYSNKDRLSKLQIGMSAPEIMARTRARMTETKDQPFRDTVFTQSREVATASTPPKHHQHGSNKPAFEVMADPHRHPAELDNQAVAQSDLSEGDSNTSNTKQSTAARDRVRLDNPNKPLTNLVPTVPTVESHQPCPPPSDLRQRLLDRLEQERREATKVQLPNLDMCSTFPVMSVFHQTTLAADNETSTPIISSPVPSNDPVISQAMEERLRTRAQLRVRLAAAKRVDPSKIGEYPREATR